MEYDNIYQVLPHGPGVRVVFRLKVSENKIGLHDSIIFRPELPYASAFELPVGTFFEADEFCNEGAEEDCIHMDSNSYDPPLITTHTDTTDIASEEVIVQVKYLKVKRYQTGKKDYKQCYRRPQDWVELGDDRLCWIPIMYPYSAGGKPPGQQPVVCQIKPEIKAIVIPPKPVPVPPRAPSPEPVYKEPVVEIVKKKKKKRPQRVPIVPAESKGIRWWIVHENFKPNSSGIGYRKLLNPEAEPSEYLFATHGYATVGNYLSTVNDTDPDFLCALHHIPYQKMNSKGKGIELYGTDAHDLKHRLEEDDPHPTFVKRYIKIVDREPFGGFEWLPVHDPYIEKDVMLLRVPEENAPRPTKKMLRLKQQVIRLEDDELTRMLAKSDGADMRLNEVILDKLEGDTEEENLARKDRQNRDKLHFKHMQDWVKKNSETSASVKLAVEVDDEELRRIKEMQIKLRKRLDQERLYILENLSDDEEDLGTTLSLPTRTEPMQPSE
jgi:hypothetical protein